MLGRSISLDNQRNVTTHSRRRSREYSPENDEFAGKIEAETEEDEEKLEVTAPSSVYTDLRRVEEKKNEMGELKGGEGRMVKCG